MFPRAQQASAWLCGAESTPFPSTPHRQAEQLHSKCTNAPGWPATCTRLLQGKQDCTLCTAALVKLVSRQACFWTHLPQGNHFCAVLRAAGHNSRREHLRQVVWVTCTAARAPAIFEQPDFTRRTMHSAVGQSQHRACRCCAAACRPCNALTLGLKADQAIKLAQAHQGRSWLPSAAVCSAAWPGKGHTEQIARTPLGLPLLLGRTLAAMRIQLCVKGLQPLRCRLPLSLHVLCGRRRAAVQPLERLQEQDRVCQTLQAGTDSRRAA